MSEWIPPGHRTHDGQPDCDVRWCECSGRCTSNAPCDCCELAELRIEVERLTADYNAAVERIHELLAEKADRDRRIAEVLPWLHSAAKHAGDADRARNLLDLAEKALRGES